PSPSRSTTSGAYSEPALAVGLAVQRAVAPRVAPDRLSTRPSDPRTSTRSRPPAPVGTRTGGATTALASAEETSAGSIVQVHVSPSPNSGLPATSVVRT